MDTIQQIQHYYLNEKLSTVKIAEMMSMSASTVYHLLKKSNVNIRSNKENSRKYTCNEQFFKQIDTEEKAYWLGFIYADGYISNNNLGITLSEIDKDHLYKFSESIKSTYPINTYKYSGYKDVYGSRVVIKSDMLISDLIHNGVFYNKSLILLPPKNIPDNLLMHFIRGYMDGDGSISVSKTKYGDSYKLRFEGTKEMLDWIQLIFKTNCKLQKRNKDTKNSYSLDYGGNISVLSKLNLIYNNANVFLPRKYDRYKMLQSLYPVMDNVNRVNSVDSSKEPIPS